MTDRQEAIPMGERLPRWVTHVVQLRGHDGGWWNVPCGSLGHAEDVLAQMRGDYPMAKVLPVSRDPEDRDDEWEKREEAYDRATFEGSVDGGRPHVR